MAAFSIQRTSNECGSHGMNVIVAGLLWRNSGTEGRGVIAISRSGAGAVFTRARRPIPHKPSHLESESESCGIRWHQTDVSSNEVFPYLVLPDRGSLFRETSVSMSRTAADGAAVCQSAHGTTKVSGSVASPVDQLIAVMVTVSWRESYRKNYWNDNEDRRERTSSIIRTYREGKGLRYRYRDADVAQWRVGGKARLFHCSGSPYYRYRDADVAQWRVGGKARSSKNLLYSLHFHLGRLMMIQTDRRVMTFATSR
ncbi:hypothetical protein J6590_016456 [Homalodisca vitripennis]|nr:hypothetical protein J6590_016456 [Homalodisca vitripennis]